MKVLIISHNPITTYQNMGKTMLSLFASFDKTELCQLYIYPTLPNIDRCNSYFRITDKDIIRSFPFRSVKGKNILSTQIHIDQGMFEIPSDQKLYKTKHNHSPMLMFMRDLAWKMSRVWTISLKRWIEQEKPDIIFVAPGRGGFIYDMAMKIHKEYHIPIISYICDDYYFAKSKKLMSCIYNRHLRRKIKKLIINSSQVIGICDEISQKYFEEFKTPTQTLMTGASFDIPVENIDRERDFSTNAEITYFGNVRCNRYVSLKEIGQALDMINEEKHTCYKLRIFSAETDISILNEFKKVKSIDFCGYISGEKYEMEFQKSKILCHVEAFDEEAIEKVRYSISTKIADSLTSGIPLFAYGPSDVASLSYLLNNDCAIVCTNKEELKEKLQSLFHGELDLNSITKNALNVSKNNHDAISNSNRLHEGMMEILFREKTMHNKICIQLF